MAVGEADYSLTHMALGMDEDSINPADYEGLLVKFTMHPIQNYEKSQEAGRPIFEEIPFVDIRVPGDRSNHQFRPAAEIDLRRWPKHWEAFQNRVEAPSEGTPLEEWPSINKALVEELKFFHIKTIEQLANISDSNAQNFMGMQDLKAKAKAWLAQAGENAEAEALASELTKRDDMIQDLQIKLDALTERLAELEVEED